MIIRRRILLPTEKEYEFVDLGLPSGLLWAKCNVGATTETDPGLYFAWGETVGYTTANEKIVVKDGTTYTGFTWESYKYIDDPTSVSDDNIPETALTKYNATDGKTRLDLEDDAARVIMGEEWRMPTEEDLIELRTKTDMEWTTIDGINGWKFMKKTNHSVYVFFPAAGWCYNGTSITGVGEWGYYWSSSLSDDDNASGMVFFSRTVYSSTNDRNCGLSIRAVRE